MALPLLLFGNLYADEIDELILKLGSTEWHERESATARLARLGSKAVPHLRRLLSSPDLELRHRAMLILESIRQGRLSDDDFRAREAFKKCIEFAKNNPDKRNEIKSRFLEISRKYPGTKWAEAALERAKSPAPTPVQKPEPDLGKLLSLLGDPDWRKRKEATESLIRAGEGALPKLSDFHPSDPEVAWRVDHIRRVLRTPPLPSPITEFGGFRLEAPRFTSITSTYIDTLVSGLKEPGTDDYRNARRQLLQLGKHSIPFLIRSLESDDELFKIEVMDLLREITGENLGFDPERWKRWYRSP